MVNRGEPASNSGFAAPCVDELVGSGAHLVVVEYAGAALRGGKKGWCCWQLQPLCLPLRLHLLPRRLLRLLPCIGTLTTATASAAASFGTCRQVCAPMSLPALLPQP